MSLLDRWFPKPKSEEKKDEAPKPAQDNNPNTAAALAMYKEMTGKGKQKFAMDILGISQEQLRQIKNGTKEVQKDKKSESKATPHKEANDKSLTHNALAKVLADAYLPRRDMVKDLEEKSSESLRTIIKENARGDLSKPSVLAKTLFSVLLLYDNSTRN
jgi:hypothetical protein